MSKPVPLDPVPHYPNIDPLITNERLEDEIRSFRSRINEFIRAGETTADIVFVKGRYGAGKSHLCMRLVREIRNFGKINPPEIQLLNPRVYADFTKESREEGKEPVLVIYASFDAIFQKLERSLEMTLTLGGIINYILTQILDKDARLPPNSDLDPPSGLVKELQSMQRETYSSESLVKTLLKYYSRIIIILDEMEAIQDPLLTSARRTELVRGLLTFFNNQTGMCFILCIPEESWGSWWIGFEFLPSRARRAISIEEFDFDVAKNLLDSKFAQLGGSPFSEELAYSAWELSRHGGRNFINLCRSVYISAGCKVRHEHVCEALKSLVGPQFKPLFNEEVYKALKKSLPDKHWEIFELLFGEYVPHSTKDIISKTGVNPKIITEFLNTYIKPHPELPVPGPLVVRCFPWKKIVETDLKRQDEFLTGVGITKRIEDETIIGIDKTFNKIISLMPPCFEKEDYAYIPESFGDFKNRVRGLEEPLRRLHKGLLNVADKSEHYYALSSTAFDRLIGLPIISPVTAEIIKDPRLREEIDQSYLKTDPELRSLYALKGLQILLKYLKEQLRELPEVVDFRLDVPKRRIVEEYDKFNLLLAVSVRRTLEPRLVSELYDEIFSGDAHTVAGFVFYIGGSEQAEKVISAKQRSKGVKTPLVNLYWLSSQVFDFLITIFALEQRIPDFLSYLDNVNIREKIDVKKFSELVQEYWGSFLRTVAIGDAIDEIIKNLKKEGFLLEEYVEPDKLALYALALCSGQKNVLDEVNRINGMTKLAPPRVITEAHLDEYIRGIKISELFDEENFTLRVPESISKIISIVKETPGLSKTDIITRANFITTISEDVDNWFLFLEQHKALKLVSNGYTVLSTTEIESIVKSLEAAIIELKEQGEQNVIKEDGLDVGLKPYLEKIEIYEPLLHNAGGYAPKLRNMVSADRSIDILRRGIVAKLADSSAKNIDDPKEGILKIAKDSRDKALKIYKEIKEWDVKSDTRIEMNVGSSKIVVNPDLHQFYSDSEIVPDPKQMKEDAQEKLLSGDVSELEELKGEKKMCQNRILKLRA